MRKRRMGKGRDRRSGNVAGAGGRDLRNCYGVRAGDVTGVAGPRQPRGPDRERRLGWDVTGVAATSCYGIWACGRDRRCGHGAWAGGVTGDTGSASGPCDTG
jgi:hypothetical protein